MIDWLKNLFKKKVSITESTPFVEADHVPPAVIRHLLQYRDALAQGDALKAARHCQILDQSGWGRPHSVSQADDMLKAYGYRQPE